MKKLVVLGLNLKDKHKKRLENISNLEIFESPKSSEDFLQKTNGTDIIYSDGEYLLESLGKLKNVFITYPYVELGVFDSEKLGKNGIIIANAKGGNKNSIVEWTIFMILSLFRKFLPTVRATKDISFELQESLENKKVLIIGHGSIGSKIGILCEAFGMEVKFFERGENLQIASQDADLIINSLNCNTSSQNLLNENFFMDLKKGSMYITFSRPFTYDIDGLIKSINKGIVAGAAIDCDPEEFGDTQNEFYQKALNNPKILVTPHVAFSTKKAVENGQEIAIQNIEAFVKGNPQNIITKK